MPLAFHHHMATAIETEQDLDLLMRHTGAAVGLLYDAGHLRFAGGDVLRVIDAPWRAHRPRPRQGRARPGDRRAGPGPPILPRRRAGGRLHRPGDGAIDFAAVCRRLADAGYQGWFVVEAEQDPAKAPPAEYARIGHRALSAALAAAGYRIEE